MAPTQFDVFLSYNSRDRTAVERIAFALKEAGLEPWLDAWHLTGGSTWIAELEAGLRASRSCAVFVGPHGFGDWSRMELEIAVDRAVTDPDFRLILVLLPGVPEPFDPTTLPLFFRVRTWVDLRDGAESIGQLQPLIRAITGRGQPGSPAAGVS
jgi:hypothetical protein